VGEGGGGSLDECGPLPPGGHFLRGLAEEGAAMLGQSMMEAHPPPYLRRRSSSRTFIGATLARPGRTRELLDPLAHQVIVDNGHIRTDEPLSIRVIKSERA